MLWYDDDVPGAEIPAGFVPDLPTPRPRPRQALVISTSERLLACHETGAPLWLVVSINAGEPRYATLPARSHVLEASP